MSEDYADLLRDGWWAAVATLTQMFGDLEARRLGRAAEARDAYRAALGLAIPRPERAFVEGRLLAAQRVVTGGA